MIRPILKYGDRTLHDPAMPVDAITTEITRIIDDMIETMYAAPGVGLAAPQMGVPLRIFSTLLRGCRSSPSRKGTPSAFASLTAGKLALEPTTSSVTVTHANYQPAPLPDRSRMRPGAR